MIAIHEMGKGMGFDLLTSVHDEVNMSIPNDKDLINKVKEIEREFVCYDGVNCPIKFRIPITCQSGTGDNWFTAGKA